VEDPELLKMFVCGGSGGGRTFPPSSLVFTGGSHCYFWFSYTLTMQYIYHILTKCSDERVRESNYRILFPLEPPMTWLISQLIQYATACPKHNQLLIQGNLQTNKLMLLQGFLLSRLQAAFCKFNCHYITI
jgi:hypothetical protein